jgi:hypothetical protein
MDWALHMGAVSVISEIPFQDAAQPAAATV